MSARGSLFIVNDFSASGIWLFTALEAQRQTLAGANIFIAPYNSTSCETVPSHNSLWENWHSPKVLPFEIADQFREIAKHIDAGKNVLLFSQAMYAKRHEFFWNSLASFVDIGNLRARAMFLFGSPAILLEIHYRLLPWRRPEDAAGICGVIAAIPTVVEDCRRRLGEDNCGLAINPSQASFEPMPVTVPDAFGEFFGVSLKLEPKTPDHPLVYRSHAMRRLRAALEVRENSWPGLNMDEIGALALGMDAELGEDFLSPLEGRRLLADGRVQRAFEDMAGAEAGSLAPPAAYFSQSAASAASPLPGFCVESFISGLSAADREALRARLLNDRHFLNADQKNILETLEKDENHAHGNFADIRVSDEPPMLAVITLAYNQEKYIKQCLDSVLAQQTAFPVEHIVLDHHSTDSTPEIVAEYARNYPSIRPVLLSQRRWCENITGLYSRCRAKYAIMCDGDDYFTDPRKLQIQFDFMEKRPELSFCFHPVAAVFEDGSPTKIFPPMSMIPEKEEFELGDLVDGNFIQTNSVLYRWRFRDGLPAWFRPDLCPGDWYLHMLHAETGNFGFIPRVMSVYRRHKGAFFAASSESSAALRRKAGIAELRTCRACIEHFDKKYAGNFERLAVKVLKDLALAAKVDGDDSLLSLALEDYPEFAKLCQAAA